MYTYSELFSRDRRHSVTIEEPATCPPSTSMPKFPSNLKDTSLPPLTVIQADDNDRRPSLAALQAEDMERRPSITMYQSEDSQHPDVIAIQKLVERMKFGELEM